MAVNRSGVGAPAGSVYVAEAFDNHRISQFDEDGGFIRTWGYDVIVSGAPNDNGTGFEICDVTNGNTADECKKALGFPAPAAGQLANPQGIAIDQATGYLYVTSSINRRVDVFTGEGIFVGAFGWDVADTGDPGDTAPANQFEICTTVCKEAAAAGADAGRFSDLVASTPAVDPNNPGRVYVPDRGNLRVNQFSVTAIADKLTAVSFDKAFGWDVIPGNATTALESCTTLTTCQSGTSGNGAGQFTSGFNPSVGASPSAVAVDSTGAIYVTSGPFNGTCSPATPCRVQKFAPDASSAINFGPSSGPGQLTFTSGVANTVAGLNLAIDPDNDHVYVLRRGKGLGGEVPSSTEYQVHEYESTGSYVETHPAPAGNALPAPGPSTDHTGLSVGLEDRLYVNSGAANAGQVFMLGVKLDPHPTMSGVSDVGAASATFEGTIEIPPPGVAQYHFEYSTDESTWVSVPPEDRSAGNGTPDTYPVSLQATGLEPNTKYFVRLVATTGNEPIVSNIVEFTTGQAPPRVGLLYTEEVTQTEALLSARLDPEGLESSYRFEWTSQSEWEETGEYAHRVPASGGEIGSGNGAVIVQELVQGLEAGTAYRFRVVAENDAGETAEEQVFETLNHCSYTGDRCLELVPPADKGVVGAAGDVVALGDEMQFQASSSGSSIAYVMAYGLKDATSGNEVVYRADRNPSGWASTQLSAPNILPSVNGVASYPSKVQALSRDLSCGVLASTELLTPDAPQGTRDAGQANLYRRDTNGAYEVITSREPLNSNAGGGEPIANSELFEVIGMNEVGGSDCGTVVFRSLFQYPGVSGSGANRLYEWDEGSLYNVGVVPGPGGLEAAEVIPGASDQDHLKTNLSNHWNAVSEDATRIYFTAASRVGGDLGQQAVFMRERAKGSGDLTEGSAVVTNASPGAGGFLVGQEVSGPGVPPGTTIASVDGGTLELSQAATATTAGASLRGVRVVDVSQSQNPGTPNDSRSQYETASTDGSVVLFTARYGLTETGTPSGSTGCVIGNEENPNGPGCALYRYAVEDGTLTELSIADEETNNAQGPSVAGVLGASDDGSRVYFAALGQLTPNEGSTEAQNKAAGSYNIYLSDEGQLSYVGRLGNNTASVFRALLSASPQFWSARVSPDGRYLLFASRTAFTELGKADNGTRQEAYLYDAELNSAVCVSCRKDDEASLAPADAEPLINGRNVQNRLKPPATLAVSGDGKARAFFISYNPLATGATAGRPNLYMWEDGQTTFLGSSAPSAGQELRFAGASATGDDVYFTTVDRLTWQDTDSKLDVYDVRVGGGFEPPPPPPSPCNPLAEGTCQGLPGPGPAPAPLPGSATFVGPEKVEEAKKKRKKRKAKKHRKGKKQKGKRGKGKHQKRGKGKRGGNKASKSRGGAK